jgi:hypothetical protein
MAGKGELKHGFYTNRFVEAGDEKRSLLLSISSAQSRRCEILFALDQTTHPASSSN